MSGQVSERLRHDRSRVAAQNFKLDRRLPEQGLLSGDMFKKFQIDPGDGDQLVDFYSGIADGFFRNVDLPLQYFAQVADMVDELGPLATAMIIADKAKVPVSNSMRSLAISHSSNRSEPISRTYSRSKKAFGYTFLFLGLSLAFLTGCGGKVQSVEPGSQQGITQETASLPPTASAASSIEPTPAPIIEVGATSTPSYSDANGGAYSPEIIPIINRQSEVLTSRLIDGRYIAGQSNLEREYSPEAGLIFAKIIGAPIEQFDIDGNLIASYPPGTRVMESQIPGNEGELLFFGPAGVNNSRRAAGLSEIPEDQMVFKLTADGIPYALTLDGVLIGSVIPTSNPEVAPWIPPEVLTVNSSIRVIKPVTEGQEWPKGGFDETGQTLLAQMNRGGKWEKVNAEVAVAEATATATAPAPSPEPSSTPAPSATPRPTEIPPSPTPEGPETYGLTFSSATSEEIDLALDNLSYKTGFPLRRPAGYDGYELSGILANSKIVEMDFQGGYHVIYEGVFYFHTNDGVRHELGVNLLTTRDEGDLIKTAMVALPRSLDNPSLIKMTYSELMRNSTVPARLILSLPDGNPEILPGLGPEVVGPKTFLAPIYEQLGLDSNDLSLFVQTGDTSGLRQINGRPFLPPTYLFLGD